MTVETKLVTAEELLRMPDQAGVELIDGEIKKMSPAGSRHGRIAGRVHSSLGPYADQHELGVTLVAEAGFIIRRSPDTVRAPDVAFVRKERWTDSEGYFPGPPDLAVEVISPSDTYTEVRAKVIDWIKSGAELVIVIDPGRQSAEIHRSLAKVDLIDIDGSLDGGTVVPGWTLPLRDLFVS